jgi:hypothetical protein
MCTWIEHYYKMWVQFIDPYSLNQWIHYIPTKSCSLCRMNSFKYSEITWHKWTPFVVMEPFTTNMLKLLVVGCILHLITYIEICEIWCFAIMLEWFSEFFHCQRFHMNWIIHFECVKSINHKLPLHSPQCFWNWCIKTWQVSHLYLNGLLIKSNVHVCKV